MNSNAELAGATLGHLLGLGVEDIVVCAGARNAPLVVSLLDAVEEQGLQVWHHFDERTAAFFGLGLAKRNSDPVAVLTTSGTAVAELLPAVIEAYYSGIPLILVTADRPSRFRGSGAPQAIEQEGIFGSYAPVSIDVESPTDLSWVLKWDGLEPLHINVCLEEPSASDRCEMIPVIELPQMAQKTGVEEGISIEAFVAKPEGLVVLLGELPPSWRVPVENFLVQLGAPVWAEATSGLRESEALSGQLIRVEKSLSEQRPDQILRIGGVPSLRFWRDLESHEEIAVMSVTRRPFTGLARASRILVSAEFPTPPEVIRHAFAEEERLGDRQALNLLLEKHPESEVTAVWHLSQIIPEDALLFLGNSLPIREWNLAATLEKPHERCYANRGANGIDGELATFLGLSEGEPESWVIVGDLTALYDQNAPELLSQLSEGRRRIVVLNNGGGRIFSRLPSMKDLADEAKAVTENYHDRRFSGWADMWGMEYVAWKAGEPEPTIEGNSVVVEVILDHDKSERFWADWK